MFNKRLSSEGRKTKATLYQSFIDADCSSSQANIAAEALALENEDFNYERSDSDKRAISACWQKLTGRGTKVMRLLFELFLWIVALSIIAQSPSWGSNDHRCDRRGDNCQTTQQRGDEQ